MPICWSFESMCDCANCETTGCDSADAVHALLPQRRRGSVGESCLKSARRAVFVQVENRWHIRDSGATRFDPRDDVGFHIVIVNHREPHWSPAHNPSRDGGLDDNDVGLFAGIEAVAGAHGRCGFKHSFEPGVLGGVVQVGNLWGPTAAAATHDDRAAGGGVTFCALAGLGLTLAHQKTLERSSDPSSFSRESGVTSNGRWTGRNGTISL